MTYLFDIHFKNKKIHEMQKKIHEVDFQKSEAVVWANLGTAIRLFRVRLAADGGGVVFLGVTLQGSHS